MAGFAAETLRPALERTLGAGPASHPRAPASAGGPRSYAQAASAPPPAPRRPQPAPWVPEHTALLAPGTAEQRHAPTRASAFGAALDAVLRRELGLGDRPAVELVRRTGKGDYAIQFSAGAWSRVARDARWTVPGFGTWTRASDRPLRPRGSVVLTGISKSLTEAAMTQELAAGAAQRWPAVTPEELRNIRVERLNRRLNENNGQSNGQANEGKGPGKWVPSTSVRLHASRAVCEAILQDGGAVVGYAFHPARPYEPMKRRCFRCGQVGVHSAKFCRNTPRCRICGKEHETTSCPTSRAHSPTNVGHNAEHQELRTSAPNRGAAQGP